MEIAEVGRVERRIENGSARWKVKEEGRAREDVVEREKLGRVG